MGVGARGLSLCVVPVRGYRRSPRPLTHYRVDQDRPRLGVQVPGFDSSGVEDGPGWGPSTDSSLTGLVATSGSDPSSRSRTPVTRLLLPGVECGTDTPVLLPGRVWTPVPGLSERPSSHTRVVTFTVTRGPGGRGGRRGSSPDGRSYVFSTLHCECIPGASRVRPRLGRLHSLGSLTSTAGTPGTTLFLSVSVGRTLPPRLGPRRVVRPSDTLKLWALIGVCLGSVRRSLSAPDVSKGHAMSLHTSLGGCRCVWPRGSVGCVCPQSPQ